MEKLQISQSLIWAIIHKNPSNSFYAITAESKRVTEENKRVTDRQTDGQTDRQGSRNELLIVTKNLKDKFLVAISDSLPDPGRSVGLSVGRSVGLSVGQQFAHFCASA